MFALVVESKAVDFTASKRGNVVSGVLHHEMAVEVSLGEVTS